jgi:hypothetical protein
MGNQGVMATLSQIPQRVLAKFKISPIYQRLGNTLRSFAKATGYLPSEAVRRGYWITSRVINFYQKFIL